MYIAPVHLAVLLVVIALRCMRFLTAIPKMLKKRRSSNGAFFVEGVLR